MTRILIGHMDFELPPYDRERFDVQVVRFGLDGQNPPATIAEMLRQCPPGWKPDIYYHHGGIHFPIPADIETFDGLTATDIQDWHRGGRGVWAGSGFFDLICTERRPCEMLKSSGYDNAIFARFWGVNPDLHRILPGVARDIDVLFIGSLNAAVWEERNRWIARLARLSSQYRVVIASGHYGEHYVQLTNRAKIVFNRSVNGCTNQRAYDGSACGALVFNEEANTEAREIFEDGVHCVYYSDENFERLLAHYLDKEEERARIVEASRELVLAEHTESAHMNALFALLEANREKAGYRPYAGLSAGERGLRKALQIFCCARPAATGTALMLLDTAEKDGADPARCNEARAALHGWLAHYLSGEDKLRLFSQGIQFARRAMQSETNSAVLPMTLAFLLLERAEATQGQLPTERSDIGEAVGLLEKAASCCENPEISSDALEGFGYPRWSDSFDCYVERAYLLRGREEAAWRTAKRAAIAWRCRTMLSDLAAANGNREAARRQAEMAAQDLPAEAEAWLRLARCEAMAGALESATQHYREGLTRTPLAYQMWPEYARALETLGCHTEAQEFVQDCLQMLKAIPAYAAIRPALLASRETVGAV